MGLGEPLSLALGGGPSPQEEVYDAMRQNVGNGIQGPEGSLVEKWRNARARGIAAFTQDDRAASQAFPDISTDYLPVWEDILDIPPQPGASLSERQATVLVAYTRVIDASFPKLEDGLKSIDELMSILLIPHDLIRTTVPGRAFEDWDPTDPSASGPPFRLNAGGVGNTATGFPNFSDEFILTVLFDVGAGLLSVTNQRSFAEAQDLLNESLPAWVDFRLHTACGFILDQDLLDVTLLCDGIVIGP